MRKFLVVGCGRVFIVEFPIESHYCYEAGACIEACRRWSEMPESNGEHWTHFHAIRFENLTDGIQISAFRPV